MTINVGVIGLGVGECHAATYASMDDVCLLRVADQGPSRPAEAGARLDARHLDQDWQRVTDDPDIDVVSICS